MTTAMTAPRNKIASDIPVERRQVGRPKGAQNKVNATIKAMITGALSEVGGQDYLVRVANEDPRTFCALVGKVIPLQIGGDPDNPIHHKVSVDAAVERVAGLLDSAAARKAGGVQDPS